MIIGGAVFGDVDGQLRQKGVELAAAFHDTVRVNLPAEIIHRHARQRAVAQAGCSGAGIIIEAQKIGVGALISQQIGPIDTGLEQIFRDATGQTVPEIAGRIGGERPHMGGKPHLGLRPAHFRMDRVDQAVGAAVAFAQHLHNPQGMQGIAFPRRKTAPQIAAEGVDIRFVDGDVLADQIAQPPDGVFHHGQVALHRPGAQKASLPFEPHGIGKMVECKQHFDAVLPQQGDLLAHLLQLFFAEFPFPRLQSGPFQPKAVVADAHFSHQAGILLQMAAVVGGNIGIAVILDAAL